MDRENLFWNINSPVNKAPFQAVRMPPDAPMEGKYSNLLNLCGQTLCIYVKSKNSLFVSCKHTIPAALSSIFGLRASHLSDEFIPLMFQSRIYQDVLLFTSTIGIYDQPLKVHPLRQKSSTRIISRFNNNIIGAFNIQHQPLIISKANMSIRIA